MTRPSDVAAVPPTRKRRGRPSKSNSAETRANLIESARKLFAENGYDRAAVSEVCRGAEIVPSAFYHYFPDKESLYEAVFDASITKVWDVLQDSIRDKSTAREALAAFVNAADRAGETLPHFPEFLTALPLEASRNPRFRRLVDHRTELQRRSFERIAEIGTRNAEFPDDLDTDELAEHLRFTVMGWLLERNLSSHGSARTDVDGLLRLLRLTT
ncbi:TetR/AcrR family transcriptional regulator [Gordonia mangrovi]|nr:TetR/AcrR family transcriptional regulator [Gordonia mangrovi]UVF79394.1 TetR/AcrR family transcriptional regulator [Gordonia mangrovi]